MCCEGGCYLSRSATLLYLIWTIGQVVKFSFFAYFFAEIVIHQQDYYYRSAFILLDKQFLSLTTNKTASVLWCGRRVWCSVCGSADASGF